IKPKPPTSNYSSCPQLLNTALNHTQKLYNLWVHDERFSKSDLILHPEIFAWVPLGSIVEIYHPIHASFPISSSSSSSSSSSTTPSTLASPNSVPPLWSQSSTNHSHTRKSSSNLPITPNLNPLSNPWIQNSTPKSFASFDPSHLPTERLESLSDPSLPPEPSFSASSILPNGTAPSSLDSPRDPLYKEDFPPREKALYLKVTESYTQFKGGQLQVRILFFCVYFRYLIPF
ncbi:hypothetical protein HMI55_006302, partial [Coelomomyces lativittatus]